MSSSEDDYDPDYRESSDDSDESEIPRSMFRDRARWIEENVTAIEDLFGDFKASGRMVFGESFFQTGTINNFCNLIYKYTTPGAA